MHHQRPHTTHDQTKACLQPKCTDCHVIVRQVHPRTKSTSENIVSMGSVNAPARTLTLFRRASDIRWYFQTSSFHAGSMQNASRFRCCKITLLNPIMNCRNLLWCDKSLSCFSHQTSGLKKHNYCRFHISWPGGKKLKKRAPERNWHNSPSFGQNGIGVSALEPE